MKLVSALAAVIVMLGTPLPGVAQARDGGPADAKTSAGKAQARPAGTQAKPKPEKKLKDKPKAKPKDKPKAKTTVVGRPSKKTITKSTPKTAKPTSKLTPADNSTLTGAGSVTAATPTIPPVRNQSLEARLQPLLPNGMNVSDASRGFKNWGRFVAAVHASRNLNIPFQSLKLKMTGDMPLSLGQAIQAIRSGSTTPTSTMTYNRMATTASAVTQAEQQSAEDFRHVRDDNR